MTLPSRGFVGSGGHGIALSGERDGGEVEPADGLVQLAEAGPGTDVALQARLSLRRTPSGMLDGSVEGGRHRGRLFVEIGVHRPPAARVGHLDVSVAAEIPAPPVLRHDDESSVEVQVSDWNVVPATGSSARDVEDEQCVVQGTVER